MYFCSWMKLQVSILINIVLLMGTILTGLFSSCSSATEDNPLDERVLVQVGDSVLTLESVLRKIPAGLMPEDSAQMFHQIVDSWVRDMVIADIAEKNVPNLDEIERMVDAYRNELIVSRYLSYMGDNSVDEIPEEKIKKYYEDNRGNMRLQQPLIKGALLKIDNNAENLDKLRGWMSKFTDESTDKIEKNGLKQASKYLYFRDEWQEWERVASQIPYRFEDADLFVKNHKNFETEANGSVYLLHISELIPSGEEMPYEYARIKIAEILRIAESENQKKNLINNIYKTKIQEGYLKPGIYNPLTKELLKPEKL